MTLHRDDTLERAMTINEIRRRVLPWQRTRKPADVWFWTLALPRGMRVIGSPGALKGAIIAVMSCCVPPAFADVHEDMQKILESAKEIARQRDEAIKQRDYWASRDCRDQYVMRFPERGSNPIDTTKAMVLSIEEGASAKTLYTMAHIAPPGVSLCLLEIGNECVLKYDAETQSFIATRPWNVRVLK